MYQSRIKNGKKRTNRDEKHRGIIEPDEFQEYAIVQDLLGNGRLRVMCIDENLRIARIRGNMRKSTHKVIIEKGDLILISRRDFEEDKVDVIHKYSREEAISLLHSKKKLMPSAILKAWTNSTGDNLGDDDDNVIFYDEEAEKEKEKVEKADEAEEIEEAEKDKKEKERKERYKREKEETEKIINKL